MTRRETRDRRYRRALGIALGLSVGIHAVLLAGGRFSAEPFSESERAENLRRDLEEVPDNWEKRPLRLVRLKAPEPAPTPTTEASSAPVGPAAQSEASEGGPAAPRATALAAAPAADAARAASAGLSFKPVMRPVAVLETVESPRTLAELPRVRRTAQADPAVLAFRARMERREESRVSWRPGNEAARVASRGGVWNESGSGSSSGRGGFVLVGGGGGGHCASGGGFGAVNRRGPGLIGIRF